MNIISQCIPIIINTCVCVCVYIYIYIYIYIANRKVLFAVLTKIKHLFAELILLRETLIFMSNSYTSCISNEIGLESILSSFSVDCTKLGDDCLPDAANGCGFVVLVGVVL